MIETGGAPPRQPNTPKALKLDRAIAADEEAKQQQRDKDAQRAAAVAEKSLREKRAKAHARRQAERESKRFRSTRKK